MSATDLFKAVMELNLEPIKKKLMHVQSGEGWTQEKANVVEKEYRRFLCLMKLYPEEETTPLADVDTFWHYHILDTMKYAADCESVFGYFLHHYPHFGLDGTEIEEQERRDGGQRMQELYEATFGDPYPGSATEEVQALAFSAGPWRDKAKTADASQISSAIAFSAGPWRDKAETAGASQISSAIAFSAGPWRDKAKTAGASQISSAIAFSAGPWRDKAKTAGASQISSAIAFSAGPWRDKVKTADAGKGFAPLRSAPADAVTS
ncbi:MAG: hypothetical protein WCC39_02405 [Telluria sp.]